MILSSSAPVRTSYDRGIDPIQILEERAAEKRDYAIKLARKVYQQDLAAIEALECALPATIPATPDDPPQAPNTMTLIESLLPDEKLFTVAVMMGCEDNKSWEVPAVGQLRSRQNLNLAR